MTAVRSGLAADARRQRRVRSVARTLDHGEHDAEAIRFAIVVVLGLALLLLSVADLVMVLGVLM